MKAIVYERYGAPDEVLEPTDMADPEVKDRDVLVRVHAAGLNPADWHFLRGLPYVGRLMVGGLRTPRRPTIVGSDMAGRVEAVGKDVSRFRSGDEVFAEVGFGGCAEYVAVPENEVDRKPSNLTFEQAAAVPMAGMTALVGVRDKGAVQPGHKVLINGASGGVGTFAVQIAKAFGAEVTAVCSARNAEMVRSIGADHVIDYTQQDFTRTAERYDLILDTIGNHSVRACRRVMAPSGTYGAVGGSGGRWLGPLRHQLRAMVLSPFVSQKMVAVNDRSNADLPFLREWAEAGRLAPVIDRTYSLADTAAAIAHLEGGHARGKVVVTI